MGSRCFRNVVYSKHNQDDAQYPKQYVYLYNILWELTLCTLVYMFTNVSEGCMASIFRDEGMLSNRRP
jgi:hypothetical protein